HAARLLDWLRPRHPEPDHDPADHRAGESAGIGGCGRRHGLGRGGSDGTRLRRGADEHRHRPCQGPDHDGARHEGGGGGWASCLSRRPHAEEALCRSVLAPRRIDLIAVLRSFAFALLLITAKAWAAPLSGISYSPSGVETFDQLAK